jgi:hypothetical protein
MDSPDLVELGAALVIDAATVELTVALQGRGVDPIVLRGPAIAARLYPREPRRYDDVDLLVSPAQLAAVEEALRGKGFDLTSRDVHAAPWVRRSDGIVVDVHTSMIGIGVSDAEAWDELAARTEVLALPGGEVRVPTPPALALGVALHAAQHGIGGAKSLEDLTRAIDTFAENDWGDAAALAGRLRAGGAFATGLRLLPAGAALAERLRLPVVRDRELALRASSAPATALGFWRLAETRGVRAKAGLIAHEIAPSPAFMRAMYPVAARGRLGLAASYLWRPLVLARQLGPGFAAWRRARRG